MLIHLSDSAYITELIGYLRSEGFMALIHTNGMVAVLEPADIESLGRTLAAWPLKVLGVTAKLDGS